jgi:hypothetical protein
VVKEVDSKSTGLRPRRFESCRCRKYSRFAVRKYGIILSSPVVKWLSLLTLNQPSQVRTLAGECGFIVLIFANHH